ncbi:hypothetical protein COMNV_01286 [Commensalibacter sp. Nvir]|uniref:hypothetical protein n=1 Tax=Commensalibacter sp. Nvir TaxID=3069817 RepID=UPI002D74515C|nr:hypothetical protein COMNV_01286 [Commensalibacter sp. Nvir]
MFKAKYVLALTGLLLSFASFNTASYATALTCPSVSSGYIPLEFDNAYINRVGFLADQQQASFSIKNQTYTFYNGLASSSNSNILSLEITAFLSHIPVHLCGYEDNNGITWANRLEIEKN